MLTIVENALTAETYCRLRQKVRFRPYRPEDAAAALKNSLFTTEVRENGQAVGIARIVGDGRIVFFFKDIVVDPDRQGHGIGQMLMESLLRYVNAAGCDGAYVGLMATPEPRDSTKNTDSSDGPRRIWDMAWYNSSPCPFPKRGRPSPTIRSISPFESTKEDFL